MVALYARDSQRLGSYRRYTERSETEGGENKVGQWVFIGKHLGPFGNDSDGSLRYSVLVIMAHMGRHPYISLAFMLSSFISMQVIFSNNCWFPCVSHWLYHTVATGGFPYSSTHSLSRRVIWSFFPPNTFSAGFQLLIEAASVPGSPGISWSKRDVCAKMDDATCFLTMNKIYIWLVRTFFSGLCVHSIYFDNIIPNASGVRKTIFYFLKPSYWTGKEGNKVEEGRICSCFGSVPPVEHLTPDDQDVLEEETLVKKQAMDGTVVLNIAVQIHGLAKMYPGMIKLAKDQLFCLLGPNGAWKKTTISCLTGINPVTGGDALIYGDSIRSSVGMSNIRKMIGVCPQFDILWDALSSEEHLHLFASIKGLPPVSIKPIAEKLLADVKLTGAAKIRAGSYCGGMKRRLSVAIALIGDPKLVFLDEPESKKGRAIILTTHSMEEADILGDRIGIMAKGRLRCIGTSIRLKSRFGTGFITTVSFLENKNNSAGNSPEPLKRFFKKHLKVEPIEEKKAFMTFVIPHDKQKLLAGFFEELQYREYEFGISDIQLGLATLEEVFLNITRWAELESATAEGTVVTLELESGILVEIPVGARFVRIPGTENAENPRGMMVEVLYWQQDGCGSMCISGHSPEMRTPQNFSVLYEPPSQVLGRTQRRVRGSVIAYESSD
ncbi:hypothetical protein DY000_02040992 [Brassica cretica]|uniref:ABC transporter domain-containing protein n=1 Tax=Brassica cretica TaxID=69181 RepID=A0ABQ7BLY4_BRACR|nr:hypothetical protein DY000_02040992 [Brassica cretica]